MAKQNPELMLLKLGNSADPVVYGTVCGLKSRDLKLDGDTVDVTSSPCDGSDVAWREKANGVSQISFSGNGYFENKAQAAIFVDSKLTGTGIVPLQVVVPGLGVFTGNYMIDSLGFGGELGGGAVTQELSFSSSGAIVFVAES